MSNLLKETELLLAKTKELCKGKDLDSKDIIYNVILKILDEMEE